jgi:hypothetical protein
LPVIAIGEWTNPDMDNQGPVEDVVNRVPVVTTATGNPLHGISAGSWKLAFGHSLHPSDLSNRLPRLPCQRTASGQRVRQGGRPASQPDRD